MQRSCAARLYRFLRRPATAALAVAWIGLAGCTEVPDYANPVEWYHGVFGDEEPADQNLPPAEAIPGAHEPFPSLGEVPEAPSRESTMVEVESVAEGLAADRDQARYTDEVIRAEGDSVSVIQPGDEPPPAPQPTEAQPSQPQPTQPQQQQAAAAPQPTQPQPTQPQPSQPQPSVFAQQPSAASGPINVKNLFASLFEASGAGAVAPQGGGTQFSAVPTTSVPSASWPQSGASAFPSYTVPSGASGASLNRFPGAGQKVAIVYFDPGSAKLSAKARDVLAQVAQLHRERGGALRVVGHASSRTRELSVDQHSLVNFRVSFDRARAVADELIRLGVPARQVRVTAKSDSEPLYYEWMPSGEAGNRRAEVFLEF